MKQIQPFQKHWLQLTSIVVCRLNSLTSGRCDINFTKVIFKHVGVYYTDPVWLSLAIARKFAVANQQIFIHLWGTVMLGVYYLMARVIIGK